MDDLRLRDRELPRVDDLEELPLENRVPTRRDEHRLEPLDTGGPCRESALSWEQLVQVGETESKCRVDRSFDAHGLDVQTGEIDDRPRRARHT